MFCEFSFPFLLNYYYLLYVIYEHRQIHTLDKIKLAIRAVPSLRRVVMTLKCTFMLSDNQLHLLLTLQKPNL